MKDQPEFTAEPWPFVSCRVHRVMRRSCDSIQVWLLAQSAAVSPVRPGIAPGQNGNHKNSEVLKLEVDGLFAAVILGSPICAVSRE